MFKKFVFVKNRKDAWVLLSTASVLLDQPGNERGLNKMIGLRAGAEIRKQEVDANLPV